MRRIPPPQGDPDAPPRALIFDSVFDQYRGVIAYVRVVDGAFHAGEAIRAMQAGTRADIDDIGFLSPDLVKTKPLAAGEVGYIITGIKTSRSCASATPSRPKAGRRPNRCPGIKEARPVVFCGLYPLDTDRYADLRDALEKLALNDASLSYRARDLAGARLRLPLRVPRPAAHGHRARAPRARVRPRPARDDTERRVPRAHEQRRDGRGPQPDRHARPELHRGRRGALHPRQHHHAAGLRGTDHGAVPGPPRHARRHALPVRAARAAALRPAARGDRARLLRPAEVTQPRATGRSTTS